MTDQRAVLRRLLAIWDTEDERQKVVLRTDIDLQVSVVVRGLTAHAGDCARAVLTLYDASQPVAAVPVIRALMEDAMTAAWVLLVPNGWMPFISEASRTRAAVLNDAANAGQGDAASEARRQEYLDQVKTLGRASGSYTNFEQRLRAIEGTEQMYSVYRYLSSLSHASGETVDLYTAPSPASELMVSYRRVASHSMSAKLLISASTSLLHALVAWDATQVEHPHRSTLEGIAQELGVSADLRLRSQD